MFTDEQGEVWLTPKEAGAYVRSQGGRATLATLATLRSNGNGPSFMKRMGGILYRQSGLDKWMQANSSPEVKSTSELKKLKPNR
jgi:streptogramin lyase